MQYCRFSHEGRSVYGLIESVGGNQTITRTLAGAPKSQADFDGGEKCQLPFSSVRLLVPAEPSKIVCIGRNYREHAKELNHPIPTEPLLFLQPPSSLIAQNEEIRRPMDLSQRVDYEGELCAVVGKRCSRLRQDEDVRPYIVGYTCLNDVTTRDLQNKDGQWSRAKGFDTFCPVGPLVTDEIDPWAGIGVETRVNGELRQQGNTRDFIFSLDVIIRYITQAMTLVPGDLIATGTPKGVGPVVAGDAIEISVEGVGTLRNSVVNE